MADFNVLVQPEMERGRSSLVSIPPFGRGFPRHRYDHQAIPQHGCVPAEPASVSPGKIVVAPPRPSVSTYGFAVTQELALRIALISLSRSLDTRCVASAG